MAAEAPEIVALVVVGNDFCVERGVGEGDEVCDEVVKQ
jgi:hypothetical protein